MVPPARKASAKGLSWFAGGAVAGALDTCVTMPLDTVKTKMHLKQYAGPLSCAQAIVRADGAAGLYYGFRPFVIQASGKAAVRFRMFDALRRAVDGAGIDRSANPAAWSLTLGFGAGMAEALFWTAPTERLKILRQAKAGEGVGGAVGELSVTTAVAPPLTIAAPLSAWLAVNMQPTAEREPLDTKMPPPKSAIFDVNVTKKSSTAELLLITAPPSLAATFSTRSHRSILRVALSSVQIAPAEP